MRQHSRGKARLAPPAWGVGVRTLLEEEEHLGKCFMHAPAYAGQCGTGVGQIGTMALSVPPRRHTH